MKRDIVVLQLRVLTGLHAGAREFLADAEYVLGSDAQCDFVLADAGVLPRHARLVPHEEGWQLQWLGEDKPPVVLRSGIAAALGPVIITVDEAEAPWPSAQELAQLDAAPVPAAQPPSTEAPDVATAEAPSPVHATLPSSQPAASAASAASAPRTNQWMPVLVVVGVAALLCAAALVAWPKTQPPPELPVVATPVAPSISQRAAIEKVLQATGFARRVKVDAAGTGWTVNAGYLDDTEAETLAEALSRLSPRPGLHIANSQELRQEVDEVLARLAPGLQGTVSADYIGDQRFRLKGRLATRMERDNLLAQLRLAFPAVTTWDSQLNVAEETAQELLADLRADGWDVGGQWQDGTLSIIARLVQEDLARWEAALARAVAKHAVRMNAKVAFVPQAGRGEGLAAARMPFKIRSVMGGDAPYVVLADGAKMLTGGSRQGWTLVAIDAQSLTFDNGKQRAVVPR